MKYKFERDLEKSPLPMTVVNARRFARAVEVALDGLELEARCYSLYDEDYYQDTKAFLEKMLARLKAPHAIPAEKVYRDLGITPEDIAGGEDVEIE